MQQWMQDAIAGWPLIRANLPTFVVIIVLILGAIWWLMDWRYGSLISNRDSIITNRDSEIALLKGQRDDYRDKLGGATAEQAKAAIDAIKNQQTASDPSRPLNLVSNKYFHNERVPLDGFRYSNCTFENVTFVYDGGKTEFSNNTVRGYTIASDSPVINAAMKVFFEMGIVSGPAVINGTIANPSNTITR